MKGAVLVTLRQMIDFCYPFPTMNCIEVLTPIIPTKVRLGYIFQDFIFHELDVDLYNSFRDLIRISSFCNRFNSTLILSYHFRKDMA